ncbi:MAG: hypothetical protein WCF16_10140 [Alphaproteobacteria bacterium]
MASDLLEDLRRDIQQRVAEQIARHRHADPNVDVHRVIDIQFTHERVRLQKLAERFDQEAQTELAGLCRLLADEWLPELARELKKM